MTNLIEGEVKRVRVVLRAVTWVFGAVIAISVLSTPSSGLEAACCTVAEFHSDGIMSATRAYASEGSTDGPIQAVVAAFPAWRMLCQLTSLVLQDGLTIQPIELQLSIGARTMLRSVRRSLRRFLRIFAWSVQQWAYWMVEAAAFMFLAAAASLVDRELLKTWREKGFTALRVSITLALAVYVRLLIDRRAPMLGKALLVFAIVYGVAGSDLLPDYLVPTGLADDLIAVALASRCFMRLCPDQLVDMHAAQAAQAWNRSLRRRAWRRRVRTSPYSPLEQ